MEEELLEAPIAVSNAHANQTEKCQDDVSMINITTEITHDNAVNQTNNEVLGETNQQTVCDVSIDTKVKFGSESTHAMSHLINMGLRSAVDVKTKETVISWARTLELTEAKDTLNYLENKSTELTNSIEIEQSNVFMAGEKKKQLAKDMSYTKSIIGVVKNRATELQKFCSNLENDKRQLTRLPDEQLQLIQQPEYQRKAKQLKEEIDEKKEYILRTNSEFEKYLHYHVLQEKKYIYEVDTTNKRIEASLLELKNYKNSNEKLEKELEAKLCTYNKLTEALEKAKSNDLLTEKHNYEKQLIEKKNTHTSEMKLLMKEKEDLTEQIVINNQKIEEITSDLNDAKLKLQKLKSEREYLKSQIEEFETTFQTIQDESSANINALKTKLEDASSYYSEIQKNINKLFDQKVNLTNKLQMLDKTSHELKNKLSYSTFDFKQEQSNFENYSSRHQKLEEQLKCLEKDFVLLKQTKENYETEFAKTSSLLATETETRKNNISKATQEQFETKSKLEKELDAMVKQRDKQKLEMETNFKTQEDQYKLKINGLHILIEKLENDVVTLTSEKDSLETRRKLKRDYINSLSSKVRNDEGRESKEAKYIDPAAGNKPTVGILKSPGSKTPTKKVSFQVGLTSSQEATSSRDEKSRATADELFEALLRHSPPERP